MKQYLNYNDRSKQHVLASDTMLVANEWVVCAYTFLKCGTFESVSAC